MKSYCLINCQLGTEKKIESELNSIPEVKEVQRCFGAYDMIVELETKDEPAMRQALTWKLRRIPDVRSTMTLVVVRD